MKQRKLLELNSKVSLEAVVGETTELYFKVGSKSVRISGEEVVELTEWLRGEVLGSSQKQSFFSGKIEPERRKALDAPPAVVPARPIPFDQTAATRAFSPEHLHEVKPD